MTRSNHAFSRDCRVALSYRCPLGTRMKHAFVAIIILVCGCTSTHYTYLETIRVGTVIDRSLYSVAVPQSVSTDGRVWERYSRDGVPEDLVLKYSEGYILPSYAASITVKREFTRLATIEDLKNYVRDKLKHTNPAGLPITQSHLLCVKPEPRMDAGPSKPEALFGHMIACIDTKTRHYYELNISYMTKRKGNIPPSDLAEMAEQFFCSFSVKDYSR